MMLYMTDFLVVFLWCCICELGILLVNEMPSLVLFDSGASRCFVSLVFSENFNRTLGHLDILLDVEIAADEILNVTSVYKSCEIVVSGLRFPIDLIPFATREINVIVRKDWLSWNQAIIDCDRKLIRVQTLSGGELVIQDETRKGRTTIC